MPLPGVSRVKCLDKVPRCAELPTMPPPPFPQDPVAVVGYPIGGDTVQPCAWNPHRTLGCSAHLYQMRCAVSALQMAVMQLHGVHL